jgi:hypothetical protein
MGRVQTTVQLTDELVEFLDREAADPASLDLVRRLDAEELRQGRKPW